MKTLIAAVAFAIAIPTAAYAQATTPADNPDCCEKMKADGKDCCCKDMDKSKDSHATHETHEIKGPRAPDTPHQH